jgi:galactokinase
MVALVENSAVDDFQAHVQQVYQAQIGRAASIFACQAGPGAGLLAVISAG